MRVYATLVAGALCAGAVTASAAPMGAQLPPEHETPLVQIHHKPGHKGGPPWARQDSRSSRGYATRTMERRTICRTTLRTYYDEYIGQYVRRSVRTCE